MKTLQAEAVEEVSKNTGRPVKRPMWMTSEDYILSSARIYNAGGGDNVVLGSYELRPEGGVGYGQEEIDALVENDMWQFVDCPNNVKFIDNRYVLRS